jgi:flagellar export protein FliJ
LPTPTSATQIRGASPARIVLSLRNALQFPSIRTEEEIVSRKNRLDTVFRLRETEEDRARLALADAQRDVAAATNQLAAARASATADHRNPASAAHWSLVESAHARALHEARQAERAVQKASDGLSQTRARYLGAHTRTEALRKAIESRRAETLREERQAERKYMDEIAMLLYQSVA